MNEMGKFLVIAGLLLVAVGALLWSGFGKGWLNLETPLGILRRAGMLWDREVPEGTEPARHRSVQLSQRFAIEESGLEGVELILGGGCGAVWVARQTHLEGAVVDERTKRIWRIVV